MNLIKLRSPIRTSCIASYIVMAIIVCGPASAQISAGKVLPTLKAKVHDGTTIEIAADSGRLTVRRGSATEQPQALAVHLFQPDCLQCQAQLKALDSVHAEYAERGVLVIGIAYREGLEAARALRRELGLKLTVGAASGLDALGAGDAFAIIDGKGIVRFAQAGFGKGDQKLWREVLNAVLAGRPSPHETVSRKRLQEKDRFPSISLPSLRTGRPMTLSGAGGQLAFKREDGETTKPRAVLFFFSRYWDFSREEMVHLQKIHESHAKDGLLVFVIAMHPEQDVAKRLTRELGVTYPVFDGHGSELGRRYAYGWPAYVLDAGGVIKYTQVGFTEGDEKKYVEVIGSILDADCDVPGEGG